MKSMPVVPIEYAFLQYSHSAFMGERINVGVILGTRNGYYSFYISPSTEALELLYPPFDCKDYQRLSSDLKDKVEALMELYGSALSLSSILEKAISECFLWSTLMLGAHPDPSKRFEELKRTYIDRCSP